MTPVRRKRMTHLKILVVDDEQLVQWYLGRALKMDGHEIMTDGNVQDASAKLGSEAADVLVADLKMPGETGTELPGKTDRRGKKPKVIVCSAFVTADIIDKAY